MIPLRYIPIETEGLPPLPKWGSIMPAERTVLLLLLDPEARFMPVDLAYLHFPEGADVYKDHRQAFHNLRRSYAMLAESAYGRSNPELTGAQWAALPLTSLHLVSDLMAELKLAMEREPGVVFTLLNGKLVPHPDQTLVPGPILPRERKYVRKTKPLTGSEHPSPESMPDPAVEFEPPAPDPVPKVEESQPTPVHERKHTPLLRRFFQRYQVALLLLPFLVPSALAVYWWQLDVVDLEDIQEMGAPNLEEPYFIAAGKRYEIGDHLRFEGQVGVIQQINREGLTVGKRHFHAPSLQFFGVPMAIDGNVVVYPGSPRHIAGNFWIDNSETLDNAPLGYLSWVGGYQYRIFRGDICDVFVFMSKVSGKTVQCSSDRKIMLPQDLQFDDIIEQCLQYGGKVKEEQDIIEVFWP